MMYKENGIFKDLTKINKLLDNLASINYLDYTCFITYYKKKDEIIKQIIKLILTYILSFDIKKEDIAQFEMMIFHMTNILHAEIEDHLCALDYFNEHNQCEHLLNNIRFICSCMNFLIQKADEINSFREKLDNVEHST